jgi:hypothetical protein
VNPELSDEAIEFGAFAGKAFEAAGEELAASAVSEPKRRAALVEPVLAELGAAELDPRRSDDEAEAAAALCRAAGHWAVPYPVAEWLARPTDLDATVGGLVVVDGPAPAARVEGIDGCWLAVDLDGNRSLAEARPGAPSTRAGSLVVPLELTPLADVAAESDLALGLVLPCFELLGMLDRAVELTRSYVVERRQFGQPIAKFQGVQFQLTEAEVERTGLDVLAKYALWSFETRSPDALDDALALRAAAIEAADVVFRVTHQLHGAIGFCDEAALSWVSRASVAIRRLPTGVTATRARLVRRVGRRGLTGLFNDDVGERPSA